MRRGRSCSRQEDNETKEGRGGQPGSRHVAKVSRGWWCIASSELSVCRVALVDFRRRIRDGRDENQENLLGGNWEKAREPRKRVRRAAKLVRTEWTAFFTLVNPRRIVLLFFSPCVCVCMCICDKKRGESRREKSVRVYVKQSQKPDEIRNEERSPQCLTTLVRATTFVLIQLPS